MTLIPGFAFLSDAAAGRRRLGWQERRPADWWPDNSHLLLRSRWLLQCPKRRCAVTWPISWMCVVHGYKH